MPKGGGCGWVPKPPAVTHVLCIVCPLKGVKGGPSAPMGPHGDLFGSQGLTQWFTTQTWGNGVQWGDVRKCALPNGVEFQNILRNCLKTTQSITMDVLFVCGGTRK